ncbi:MAG: aminoacyl-tRNA hydrolase [Elusimicrobiota bacterium]
MSGKKIIVGLGNPGTEYRNTRHNLGFIVADVLCKRYKQNRACLLEIGENPEFYVVKPLTYMNKSGISVKCLVESTDHKIKDLLVICDDFNLPLGTLRLRPSGSSGGHNGLKSIIEQLGTKEFARLRLGIGGADAEDKTGYVLSEFKKSEIKVVEEMVIDSRNLVYYYIENGIEKTMNRFNS